MTQPGYFETRSFDSAREFFEHLRPSSDHWGKGLDCDWLFRGHGDASWELLPRALRTPCEELAPLHLRCGSDHVDSLLLGVRSVDPQIRELRSTFVGKFMKALSIALRSFSSLANELGHQMGDASDLWSPRPRHNYVSADEPSFVMALAQHHGIPTILLDWTRQPLVAAFFASDGEHDTDIAVWALCEGVCDPLSAFGGVRAPIAVVASPRYFHRFEHSQHGVYTAMAGSTVHNFFMREGRWPNIQDALDAQQVCVDKICLKKLVLKGTEIPELKKLLWREGISRAHLMPTLDSVSKTVIELWRDPDFRP